MSAHVNNIFSLRFFALINACIRNSDLFVRYFIRKFCDKVVFINITCSINSFIFSLLAYREHVIMYLFHLSGFLLLWLKISVSTADINMSEHRRLTNHTIDWDSAQCVTYSTNYFQRLTLESWFTNLETRPLNICQQLPAPYKRLIHDINITNEPNRTT